MVKLLEFVISTQNPHFLNLEILFTFVLATVALAISPGPDNIFVLTQSITNGKKYGLATTAGLISGCLLHTTLLAFGISAIINRNEILFLGIKVFGTCYLFYLAYRVYKSEAMSGLPINNVPKKGLGRLFWQGFIMNVLNPKVTLFFLAFFPAFLFSNQLSTVIQFYILGLLFMVVSFCVFGFIAVLSGSITNFILNNAKAGLFLKWLQIAVFVGIGIYLLLSDK